ncbi:MAG: hypothetical protein PHD76_05280 [Methylacidiphilales bacterium]|nr:hypothetical protein [Candidatus Methylacidiphilales bacterium]
MALARVNTRCVTEAELIHDGKSSRTMKHDRCRMEAGLKKQGRIASYHGTSMAAARNQNWFITGAGSFKYEARRMQHGSIVTHE